MQAQGERGRFTDRERELRELRELAERKGPALALLYGRRRVGKTYLLDHAFEGRRAFYYLAADSTAELNQAELIRELSVWLGRDLEPADFPTWRAVFRFLAELAAEGPVVVVLDEFQYLLGGEDDVVSQLVAIWDRELRGRPLMLVLCGSEVRTMEGLAEGGAPLYGRIDWAARLRPFDYWDARGMIGDRSPREAAYVYGILGGTPRFLATLDPYEELSAHVTRTVLSTRGEVHLQLANIIEQEKGIRDPRDYRAVLTAVAAGHTATDRIANAAGLGDRVHVVRRALEVLEDLELIGRERDFGAGRRAPWKIRIADPAVRFWYRFVHPNRSLLERGEEERAWAVRVEPFLNDYMGKVFERICGEAFHRHHGAWGYGAALEWLRWEGQDRNRRSIELDVVARLEEGRMLTGEIKWSSSPVDYDLHHGLRRDLEDLAGSGEGWATEALDPETSAGHVYFSAAGFTEYFTRRAAEEGRIRLLSLDDLYDDGPTGA